MRRRLLHPIRRLRDHFDGAAIAILAAAESSKMVKTIARMTISVSVRILVFFVLSILMIVAVLLWNAIQIDVSPVAHALRG